jgi:hypothetical protein
MNNLAAAFLSAIIPSLTAALIALATVALDQLRKYLESKTKLVNTEAFDSAFADLRGVVFHGIAVAEEEARRALKAQPDLKITGDSKLSRAVEVIRGVMATNPALKDTLMKSGRSIVDLIHAYIDSTR